MDLSLIVKEISVLTAKLTLKSERTYTYKHLFLKFLHPNPLNNNKFLSSLLPLTHNYIREDIVLGSDF